MYPVYDTECACVFVYKYACILLKTVKRNYIDMDHLSINSCMLYVTEYKTTPYVRHYLQFLENASIHIKQILPFSVCMLNILELYDF